MWPAKWFEGILRPLIIKQFPLPGVRDRQKQHVAEVASQELLVSFLLTLTRLITEGTCMGHLGGCGPASTHRPLTSGCRAPLGHGYCLSGQLQGVVGPGWCLLPVLHGSTFKLMTSVPFPFFFSFVIPWNQLIFLFFFPRPFSSGKCLKAALEPGADRVSCCPKCSWWLFGELGSLAVTQEV